MVGENNNSLKKEPITKTERGTCFARFFMPLFCQLTN
jgi:hypothetical protein